MLTHLRPWPRPAWLRLPAVLPAVLPACCSLCGARSEQPLCEGCRQQFFKQHRHRCVCCALPLSASAGNTCGECMVRKPAFDATVAATDYAAPVDQLVLGLKFASRLHLAPMLGRMIADATAAAQLAAMPTMLTAVPLGPRRLTERGFNQALEIAKPLSRVLGIPLDARLVDRLRDTRAQSLLHPDERQKNIRNAFVVEGSAIDRMRDQHIGVVDDVMTTGETLNELAATLKRFGAARVTNFVFARTIK